MQHTRKQNIIFWIEFLSAMLATAAITWYFGYACIEGRIGEDRFDTTASYEVVLNYPFYVDKDVSEERIIQLEDAYDRISGNVRDWIEERKFIVYVGSYDDLSDVFESLTIGGKTYLPVYDPIFHRMITESSVYINDSVYPYTGEYLEGHFDSMHRVLIHEIGHLMDVASEDGNSYRYSDSDEFATLYDEYQDVLEYELSPYSATDRHECFAEVFAAYVLQPDFLSDDLYTYIEGVVTAF